MKKFNIKIDVTLSGDIEIEAETEEQAREIALSKAFFPYELTYFHFLTSEIYDAEEITDEN